MILKADSRYLWLPVRRSGLMTKLQFFAGGSRFQEIDLPIGQDAADYYAAMDVRPWLGQEIEILGDLPEEALAGLRFSDSRPENEYPFRSRLHFTAETGWINDPNGLVYADGVWHLYHQWNPYGTEWGNMHWGHAVSRDLVNWERRDPVMAPDVYGTMFSGCGWQDHENAAGFGKDALLFFYTASGGCNQWSAEAGNRYTQRLAVSTDGGNTLKKTGVILEHIKGENRDPKVFWHQASRAYITVLFLDDYDFAVFRSQDLLHWQESQRFTAEKMRECPDLFELQVENEPGKTKWVFWSADGYYLVGWFDGYQFAPESEVLSAYDTSLPYAAQTFAGVQDRVISVAWLRTRSDLGNFRGMLSVPSELSLVRLEDGYRIRFMPVRELRPCFRIAAEQGPADGLNLPLAGRPVLLELSFSGDPDRERQILIGGQAVSLPAGCAGAEILIDHGIAEYWADGGLRYGATEIGGDALGGRIEASFPVLSARLYEFASRA